MLKKLRIKICVCCNLRIFCVNLCCVIFSDETIVQDARNNICANWADLYTNWIKVTQITPRNCTLKPWQFNAYFVHINIFICVSLHPIYIYIVHILFISFSLCKCIYISFQFQHIWFLSCVHPVYSKVFSCNFCKI